MKLTEPDASDNDEEITNGAGAMAPELPPHDLPGGSIEDSSIGLGHSNGPVSPRRSLSAIRSATSSNEYLNPGSVVRTPAKNSQELPRTNHSDQDTVTPPNAVQPSLSPDTTMKRANTSDTTFLNGPVRVFSYSQEERVLTPDRVSKLGNKVVLYDEQDGPRVLNWRASREDCTYLPLF
jgi:hypothetical protein